MNSRLLHITDTHICEQVGRRKLGYEPILNKWKWCVELAHREQCDYIVHTGDVFHKPLVPRIIEQKVSELITLAKIECGIEHIIVPGNHDIGLGTKTLDGKSILSIMFTSGVHSPTGDEAVTIIPNGQSLTGGLRHNIHPIVACHHMITPEPVMFDHYLLTETQPHAAQVVLCGDFHEGWPEPIFHGGAWWSNPGSLTRISRDKPVRCAIVDIDIGSSNPNTEVSYVTLPEFNENGKPVVLPWDKVYDAESLEQEKKLALVRHSLSDSIKRTRERGVVGYEERLKNIDKSLVKLEGSLVDQGVQTILELCNQLEAE